MTTSRPLSLVALALLAVAALGPGGGVSPAAAGTDVASTSTTTVAYSGTIQGKPEDVRLSGPVQISTVVVRDPVFGKPPTVIVSIDFSGVTGQGAKTKASYVAGGNQVLTRRLVNPDVIKVTFPVYARGTDGTSGARSALATFTLTYDVAALTSSGVSAATE